MKYHIKSLLLVNIIITSTILMTSGIFDSIAIFLIGMIALITFYDIKTLKKFLILIFRFRVLFITLFLFQLLLRRQGDIYFEYHLLKITEQGVLYAIGSLMRYFVILLSAVMLSSASPYEMIKALRTWRLPEIVIIIVAFTIQFLRQSQADFRILSQNLKKRNITFKGKSLTARFELASQLIIPIIGKLFSEIRYKVIAMELNGYGHTKKIIPYKYVTCKLSDYFIAFFFGIVLSLPLLLSKYSTFL